MTESVSESLQQCIAASQRAGIAMVRLVISDDAAWDLAEGGTQFMGLQVIVAAEITA